MHIKNYRILLLSLLITAALLAIKFVIHGLGWETLTQGSLHNSVVAGAFFVIGFLLSATIADYKESERIPSEFASIVENMYEDGRSSHAKYTAFDLDAYRKQLIKIARYFRKDVRYKTHNDRHEVHKLNDTFVQMEAAGVPPNFIVKLKQQQAQLARSLFRVNYIQNINLIPSATILARSIVVITSGLLILTKSDPFYGGLIIMGVITFILVYMLLLIRVISTPFHAAGKTQDDVSLFLVDEVVAYLEKQKT